MSIADFLKQRAVDIVVGGSFVLPNWYDQHGRLRRFACRTSRVSPFRMMVAAPVVGKVGDGVTSYFADFGMLGGTVSDTAPGGFLLELEMDAERRARMSEQLTWLERKRNDPSLDDARAAARIVPAAPHSTITFADGSTHGCFVIDVSITGAAVSADVQPEIGTPLAVGACVGRVVRTLPHGFAVRFVETQKRHEIEGLIARRGRPAADPVDPPPEPAASVAFIDL